MMRIQTDILRFPLFIVLIISGFAIAQQSDGPLKVSIKEALAGSLQNITFTYTVGDKAIQSGGGIRVEFPVAYGETEFLFWSKPQVSEPSLPGYVYGISSGGDTLKCQNYGIAGGIFQAILKEGALKKGDQLIVHYRGIVQSLARRFTVRAEWRTSEKEPWQQIKHLPQISILPQDGKTLIATYPADLTAGETFTLSLVVLDKFGNPASGFRGNIKLNSSDPRAVLPQANLLFTAADSGSLRLEGLKFNSSGFQKISLESDLPLKVATQYAWVRSSGTSYRRYFGDTHFHTGSGTRNRGFFSHNDPHAHGGDVNVLPLKSFQRLNSGGDHRGNFTTATEAYEYARDIIQLDFASASEHDAVLFDEQAWQMVQQTTDEFYEPGSFTTFFAYEWTPGIFHHIVMYKERGLAVLDRDGYPDLPALWAALDKQGKEAITIPHLTWNFREHINWDHLNNDYRRLGEIYSLWNGRFLVQPGDEPQRFELGRDNSWSYQHAWGRGHRIGVVGSTDNHLGRPGSNNYTIYTQHTGGLAVALAGKNNRDELWSALRSRRTYATTGTRIYLDFQVDGHSMGSEISAGRSPVISARVGGTNMLENVEVVKYSGDEYSVIYSVAPDAETVVFEFEDANFSEDCFYYLRVTQVSEVPGRLWSYPTNEMAWSSPVWVTMKKESN